MTSFLKNPLFIKPSALRDMDEIFKDAGIHLSENQIWDDFFLEQIEVTAEQYDSVSKNTSILVIF